MKAQNKKLIACYMQDAIEDLEMVLMELSKREKKEVRYILERFARNVLIEALTDITNAIEETQDEFTDLLS